MLSTRSSAFLSALLLFAPLSASCDSSAQDSQDKVQKAVPDASQAPLKIPDNADSKDPAIAGIRAFIKSIEVDKQNAQWKTLLPLPPKQVFSKDLDYFWNLETNKGNIIIELLPNVAPMHVTSTIYLTELGFYDEVKFHRVIKGFMAQGGDPLGNGRGGPGYKYGGEFDEKVKHSKPGMLSMANAGPGTDGSQFFLTFVPTPHLDGLHSIFGQVVRGMETVRALERFGSSRGTTTELLQINRATFSVQPKPVPAEASK